MLLHGFPQMWWCWRHQIPALAEAGYRVAAHGPARLRRLRQAPPRVRHPHSRSGRRGRHPVARRVARRWWSGTTGAAGSAGRCPRCSPASPGRSAAVSMAHPLAMRRSVRRHRHQAEASRYLWGFQVPLRPERAADPGRRRWSACCARVLARRGRARRDRRARSCRRTRRRCRCRSWRTRRWSTTAGRCARRWRARRPVVRRARSTGRSTCPCCSCTARTTRRCSPRRPDASRAWVTGGYRVHRAAGRRALPARGGPGRRSTGTSSTGWPRSARLTPLTSRA